MNILHSSSGDTSLLFASCKRQPPSLGVMTECTEFIGKQALLAQSGISRSPNIERLDSRGLRDSVSKCEPPRFLFFRDLISKIKKDCERYLPASIPLKAVKSACIRFSSDTSPLGMLAYGICAKSCGVEELFLSISKDAYTNEHALAARLCDAKELLLCDELECVAEAAFGSEGKNHPVELLTGCDSEKFAIAAGLVSSFMNVKVQRETKGRAMILAHPYDTSLFSEDLKRVSAQTKTRQLLLISANEKAVLASLGKIETERVTLLVTSSDAESIAAAKKLDALAVYAYGDTAGHFRDGEKFPPLMREALCPCFEFSFDPRCFFTFAEDADINCSVGDFAYSIAKHVERALSDEDVKTVGARLSAD